jgi:hypothetical protein
MPQSYIWIYGRVPSRTASSMLRPTNKGTAGRDELLDQLPLGTGSSKTPATTTPAEYIRQSSDGPVAAYSRPHSPLSDPATPDQSTAAPRATGDPEAHALPATYHPEAVHLHASQLDGHDSTAAQKASFFNKFLDPHVSFQHKTVRNSNSLQDLLGTILYPSHSIACFLEYAPFCTLDPLARIGL